MHSRQASRLMALAGQAHTTMGCLPEDCQTPHNLQQGRLLRMARSCTERRAAGAQAGTARNLAAAAPSRTHHATAAGLVVRPAHKADFLNLSIGRKHGDQVLLRAGGGHLADKQARHACGGDTGGAKISAATLSSPWAPNGGPDGMPAVPAAPAHRCKIVTSLTNRPALGKVAEAAQRQRASAPSHRRHRAGPRHHQPYHRAQRLPQPLQTPDRAPHLPQPAARGSGSWLEALLQAAA